MLNNAGINKPMMFLDVTEENWHRIMDVNALGVLIGMQEAAKQMIKQGKQDYPYKIINVGSILSRQAFDDVVPYSCSKHAVLAMIKGGAKALIEHNITVNGYGPGVVRTELWEQLDKDLVAIGKFEKEGESMDTLAQNMILMKRYSYPEDVVGTASFLASPESDYMTGQLHHDRRRHGDPVAGASCPARSRQAETGGEFVHGAPNLSSAFASRSIRVLLPACAPGSGVTCGGRPATFRHFPPLVSPRT